MQASRCHPNVRPLRYGISFPSNSPPLLLSRRFNRNSRIRAVHAPQHRVASENRRGTACNGVRVALRLCRSLLPLAFDLEMSSDRVQLQALRAAAESADLFASERVPVDGGI